MNLELRSLLCSAIWFGREAGASSKHPGRRPGLRSTALRAVNLELRSLRCSAIWFRREAGASSKHPGRRPGLRSTALRAVNLELRSLRCSAIWFRREAGASSKHPGRRPGLRARAFFNTSGPEARVGPEVPLLVVAQDLMITRYSVGSRPAGRCCRRAVFCLRRPVVRTSQMRRSRAASVQIPGRSLSAADQRRYLRTGE